MTKQTEEFKVALERFLAVAQKAVTQAYEKCSYCPVLSIDPNGKRYVRIVKEDPGNRSVYCFVDATNGDVLKAATWKGPAKHARGNIYSDHAGGEGISGYGALYMNR